MNGERILDVSWGTIFKIAIAFYIFYLIYLVKDIFSLFIFALIISLLFNPSIDFLQKKKVPRVLGTILIYSVFFSIAVFLIYLVTPFFASEIKQFGQFFPQYFEKVAPTLRDFGIGTPDNFGDLIKAFQSWVAKASGDILSAILAIFGGIFSIFTIFTIAIFLSLEEKSMERAVVLLTPKRYEPYILDILEKSESKVSGWFGTRVLGCIFVGFLTWLASWLFDINYAVSFGIVAGVLNFIPYIGPVLTAMLFGIFTIVDSVEKTAFILIAFVIIQLIEGNILTPALTKKFVGLPPVLVLISLMIGGKLWGLSGAILVVPFAGIIYEFTRDFLAKKREEETIVV